MARSPAWTTRAIRNLTNYSSAGGTARFCAFDLLYLDGKDLRVLPLIERKRNLRRVVPTGSPFLLYVDHVEREGERLFQLACERDLEGTVAKHRLSRYMVEDGNPAWVKIRNRHYSQLIGRDELFERRYEAAGAPEGLKALVPAPQPAHLSLRFYSG